MVINACITCPIGRRACQVGRGRIVIPRWKAADDHCNRGASGFVGRALTVQLLKSNHDVLAMHRSLKTAVASERTVVVDLGTKSPPLELWRASTPPSTWFTRWRGR